MKNIKIKTQISITKFFRVFVAASFAVLFVLLSLFLSPLKKNYHTGSAFAESVVGDPSTSGDAVDSLVSLDITHPSASVELTPLSADGTFSSSSESNSVAFDVATNNHTGYTLYISSPSGDGSLVGQGADAMSSYSIPSIENAVDEPTFSDPSSTSLNNKWGYRPSKYNGETNTSFMPAPTTTSTALDTTSTYNTTKDGGVISSTTDIDDIYANTYTIGLGARIDYNKPTGSYAGMFNLSVVGNPVPVTIRYQDTSSDASVANLPNTYEGAVSETRAPISTTIPTRTGYTFTSWCLGSVTAGTSGNDYTDTCSGSIYTASNATSGTQYIGVDKIRTSSITLKAMWKKEKYLQTIQARYQNTSGGWGNYSNYSSCTKEVYYGDTHSCSIDATTEYKAASVTSYTVTGTATKQMDVARQTYRQTIQARYQNTSGGWGSYGDYSSCTKDVYYGATHSCSIAATTEYKAASVASYTVTGANTKQMDVARQTYQQTIQIRYQNASGGWGSYGNYSSCTKAVYYGASHSCSVAADTTYAATSVASYTVTGANTKQMSASRNTRTVSLSKGTGVSSVTVTGTGVKSGSGTASATVYYGGAVTIAANMSSGYDWVNWTGSATYSNRAQSISSVTSNLSFTANGKLSKIYMQDVTTGSCPTSRTLVYDRRDEKSYYIQKIGSLCWMTSNLNIAGGTTLTSATSNVSSNYTLPASSTSFPMNSDPQGQAVYNRGGNYGGYYTWGVATASTLADSYDICPKGWRLPTSDNFGTLKSSYSTGEALVASPWYGVYAGGYSNNQFQNDGSYGLYWTSTKGYDYHYATYFSMSSGSAFTSMWAWRNSGYSVRCVAK